ncbi:6-carboxy-5,6,7,8-tetrahydropterin synthase [Fundidesulfovibrio magnetotacticus]|uniref:6-carboxy-5,6,7,8-tetrahydropterin synthase n=1 Tax=Fundidesulfovibrio magnetotacticus TaxID=2730080 RepID=A0A6V8LRT8_9BACT|nr:6-carboxytetrahydropterin synthase QueD [Fundidesulfovibrio magnetotacticus]GFK93048.1 6-carboxy-5,6,7,8-tetrahydropterin synthase [Fundidesulfovibrio magnetotacticus]
MTKSSERHTPRRGVFQLTVQGDFSSAHCLRNYQGPCEMLHGHNFHVEAVFEGERLTQDTEMLMDFKDLKAALNAVLDKLDHTHLNNLPYFQRRNPTAENLARYIYWELGRAMEGQPAQIHEVSVWEKAASKATYFEVS